MNSIKLQISALVFLCQLLPAIGQPVPPQRENKYALQVRCIDKDPAIAISQMGIQTEFASRYACQDYVRKLPGMLQSKGYVTASIDSVQFDSLSAKMVLYAGELYRWAILDAKNIDPALLDAVGWRERHFAGKPIDFTQVKNWQE